MVYHTHSAKNHLHQALPPPYQSANIHTLTLYIYIYMFVFIRASPLALSSFVFATVYMVFSLVSGHCVICTCMYRLMFIIVRIYTQ